MAHKVNMHNEAGPVSQGGPSKERRIEDRPRNDDHSNGSSSSSGNGNGIRPSNATLQLTHPLMNPATSPFIDPPDSTPPSRTHHPSTAIPLVVTNLPPNTITACDFAYKPALRFPHPLDLPPTITKTRTLRGYQKALAAAARKKGIKSPRPVSPPPQATRKVHGQRRSAPLVPTSLHGQVAGAVGEDASETSEARGEAGSRVGEMGGKERGGAQMASGGLRRDVIVVSGRDTTSTEGGTAGMERGVGGGSGEENEGGVGGGNGGEAGRRRKRDRFADWVRRLY